jgi:hypothetical protein
MPERRPSHPLVELSCANDNVCRTVRFDPQTDSLVNIGHGVYRILSEDKGVHLVHVRVELHQFAQIARIRKEFGILRERD